MPLLGSFPSALDLAGNILLLKILTSLPCITEKCYMQDEMPGDQYFSFLRPLKRVHTQRRSKGQGSLE